MEQRELESRIKQLTKCVAANEPPETALRMLADLKKEAAPTEEQLRVRSHAAFVCLAWLDLPHPKEERTAVRDTWFCVGPSPRHGLLLFHDAAPDPSFHSSCAFCFTSENQPDARHVS
jgi:hypothetical protein